MRECNAQNTRLPNPNSNPNNNNNCLKSNIQKVQWTIINDIHI